MKGVEESENTAHAKSHWDLKIISTIYIWDLLENEIGWLMI